METLSGWNALSFTRMERLGRYPLSIILSFLNETEGTSFLITKKRYAYQLLPIFRLRNETTTNGLLRTAGGSSSTGDAVRQGPLHHQNRHCFVPCPVQDPPVLLARLNTKRLYRRRRQKQKIANPLVGLTTTEIAAKEWQETDPTRWLAPELELLRFLDHDHELRKRSTATTSTTTLLVSYPRSGNTLIRTLLERTTGLVTGSDTRPDRRLSLQLAQQHNLVGEGLSSPTAVALTKTHWPERIGNAVVEGHRAILVVRNPYDAIDSYWNMNATCSHTSTLTDQVYIQFQELFQSLVKNEIDIWLKFHHYWIEECQVPLLIVRFEDLLNNTESELGRIVQFFLIGPQKQEKRETTAVGTSTKLTKKAISSSDDDQVVQLSDYWRNRITHVVSGHCHSIDKLGSYRPRSATSNGGVSIGKSLERQRYSLELLQYIHNRASDESIYPTNYLTKFGYDIFHQGFPANFSQCNNKTTTTTSLACNTNNNTRITLRPDASSARVCINVPGKQPVRSIHCPFGRKLQTWRHSVTDNDTNPLPTE